MRLPLLLPRDHPIVQREMAIWRRPATWIWVCLFMFGFGILLLASLYMLIQIHIPTELSAILVFVLYPGCIILYAVYMFFLNLSGCVFTSMTVARERDTQTLQMLRLTGLSGADILKGKLHAVLRVLFWPWFITMVLLVGALLPDFLDVLDSLSSPLTARRVARFSDWVFLIMRYGLHPFVRLFNYFTLGLLVSTLAATRSRAVVIVIVLFCIASIISWWAARFFPWHTPWYTNQWFALWFYGHSSLALFDSPVSAAEIERRNWATASRNARYILGLGTLILIQITLAWAFYRAAARWLEKGAKPLF